MSRDDVKGWVETLWPIVLVLGAVIVSWATFGARLSNAEATVEKHDRVINGTDGEGGLREKVEKILTILDERLPKK